MKLRSVKSNNRLHEMLRKNSIGSKLNKEKLNCNNRELGKRQRRKIDYRQPYKLKQRLWPINKP
jgi:hypothetical protein